MTQPDEAATLLALEVEDFEKPDLTAMHRSELEAEVVHQAKLIERFRQGIANIVREMEDEGDRVYLGSSNDADELRELDEKLTDCGNELFMPWPQGDDLYANLRELRVENARLIADIEALTTTPSDALLRAALEKVRNGYASQAKFADPEPASYFREFVRRLDAVLQSTASPSKEPTQ